MEEGLKVQFHDKWGEFNHPCLKYYGKECPNCHNTDKSKMSVIRKICGYLGSLSERPTIWGKMKEIHNRVNNKGCN